MKITSKFLFVLLACCLSIPAQSQWINSLTISPSNPTTTDIITIYAECQFPSGGCSDYTSTLSVNGTDIFASALHCLGPLSFICSYTDTLTINPLPAGIYTFHFQLDAGAGPSPCTPGIFPGPNDSLIFVVSPAVGFSEFISQDEIYVYPNPIQDIFQLRGAEKFKYPLFVQIFSPEGKLVTSTTIQDENVTMKVRELPAALYQVRITDQLGNHFIVSFIKE